MIVVEFCSHTIPDDTLRLLLFCFEKLKQASREIARLQETLALVVTIADLDMLM